MYSSVTNAVFKLMKAGFRFNYFLLTRIFLKTQSSRKNGLVYHKMCL
jgi:hypothetical protein